MVCLLMWIISKHTKDSREIKGSSSTTFPQIALLIAFPNSGTTHVTKFVTATIGTVTASNYGDEHSNEMESLLINPSWENGPFLISDDHNMILPNKFILTKTHCGGWFFDSPPEFYMNETLELFEEHCTTGKRCCPI